MFGVRYSFLASLLSLAAYKQVGAQTNGTCVCQPGEIVFTLDFALSCDNRTIVPGLPGIEDAVCVVTNGAGGAFDMVPVSVSAIIITEIASNQDNFDILKTVNYTEAFVSGDNFTYQAFSVSDRDVVANGTIPNGLQVSIAGVNSANEEIVNNIVILFTNDCTIYPVLDAGSTIGWSSLLMVEGPPSEFCPAFATGSDVPSSIPSSAPTLEDYCNCQPGEISLTLDFNLTCEERNVLTGDPGITEAECLIFSSDDPMVSDPVPVTIESVLIFELDESYEFLKVTNITQTFASGDVIMYESFVATDTDLAASGQIARGLQVTISGFNAAGDDVVNSYVILYTNQCDVYPVLTDTSIIGWTRLSMVTGPPDGLCPAFDPISTVPSIVPSNVPISVSVVPSIVPVLPETEVPVATPVIPETEAPVAAPVMPETEAPVVPPIDTPVVPPVVPPATAPVETPLLAPAEPPAMVPVAPPTDATAPSCPPISKGKGKGGKGGKGKDEGSERILRTGGGVDECPEPKETKMKKTKVKENMSMEIKKKKGKKVPSGNKAKGKNEAPKSEAPTKDGSGNGMAGKGDGKGGDDSGKGTMGKGRDNKAKGDKAKKMKKGTADKKVGKAGGDKKGKMAESANRQLRSIFQ